MVVVDEQLLGGLIKNPIQYIKHPEIGIRLSAEDSDTSDCKYNVDMYICTKNYGSSVSLASQDR